MSKFKFGIGKDINQLTEYNYDNAYSIQKSRIVVTTKDKYADLINQFIVPIDGPFWVLYILKVSRIEKIEAAKYQIANPISKDELSIFLNKYSNYFETDGRHEIWIADSNTNFQIVWDNHNILYIYGVPDQIIELLVNNKFNNYDIKIPYPHFHNYNVENDILQKSIIADYDWVISELDDDDS